jgi:hypothetical protein
MPRQGKHQSKLDRALNPPPNPVIYACTQVTGAINPSLRRTGDKNLKTRDWRVGSSVMKKSS